MNYGLTKTISLDFHRSVEKVTEELARQGFGVLTSIDVQETLKKKLNVEGKKYVILGACNPQFAHKALQLEEDFGLLLPCNVIVYEKGERTVVSAFDPMSMTMLVDNEELKPIAAEVKRRLQLVIDAV